ncbi:Predicted lipoprotein [Pseudarcicella hirudinis]|uniref:Predicted lipoprotein n=1 Tax=Pseudarcicella hirudinis TaxID=1079859 RepID=A0A1I5UQ29_9BACT|nr:DUF2279 domain-containing protein [Pseudarcicella hirudinis]SFP97345.1 Predicted lipoprotein [Pseudarcicella hirudinis]
MKLYISGKPYRHKSAFRVLLIFIAYLVSLTPTSAFSEIDSLSHPDKKRLKTLIISETAGYAATLTGLSAAWYSEKASGFRFFNDNNEWLQIDKLGHFYTDYNLCRVNQRAFLWTGLDHKKATLYAGLSGLLFMTTIEVLDGTQPEYGFSWGDMTANILGPGMFVGQEILWGESRIQPKWSFHPTEYAALSPNQLGRSWNEQWLKDYNGQTYWFSANIAKFLRKDTGFPKWLNVAVGYGIQNMVDADPAKSIARGYTPYRQYYLALDLNLQHFKTRSRLLNTLLFLADQIKIPAPTLEYNSKSGFSFHSLYF